MKPRESIVRYLDDLAKDVSWTDDMRVAINCVRTLVKARADVAWGRGVKKSSDAAEGNVEPAVPARSVESVWRSDFYPIRLVTLTPYDDDLGRFKLPSDFLAIYSVHATDEFNRVTDMPRYNKGTYQDPWYELNGNVLVIGRSVAGQRIQILYRRKMPDSRQ